MVRAKKIAGGLRNGRKGELQGGVFSFPEWLGQWRDERGTTTMTCRRSRSLEKLDSAVWVARDFPSVS